MYVWMGGEGWGNCYWGEGEVGLVQTLFFCHARQVYLLLIKSVVFWQWKGCLKR